MVSSGNRADDAFARSDTQVANFDEMNRVQTIAESQFQTREKSSRAFYLDPDLRGNKVTEITFAVPLQ